MNTPRRCPVNRPRGGVRIHRPYVWYYRTEVRNHTAVPLRIVSFEPQRRIDGRWKPMGNVTGHALTSREFAQWYTEGDALKDGWLAPGAAAVCDPNYTWDSVPKGARNRWVFIAEDAHGRRYHAAAEIELLSGR